MENTPLSIEQLRQSATEVLACAVLDLYPETLLFQGESTPFGFYYEFVFKSPIDQHFLPQIEERMRALITEDTEIQTLTMIRQNAIDFFQHHNQSIKADLLADEQGQFVELFKLNDFFDAAPTPYVTSTRELSAFKLLTISSLRKAGLTITRIEGTVCQNKQELKQVLKTVEAARKCDHRLLGPQLGLYSFNDYLAPGCCLWHPKGNKIREALIQWWNKEHAERGYSSVSTPCLVHPSLLQKAGFQRSEELALPQIEIHDDLMALSPVISPQHLLLFAAGGYDKHALPVRYSECREVYSGIKDYRLDGLFKTRSFVADCATIFCTNEQLIDELISSLQFIDRTIRIFDFESKWYLRSIAPSKVMNTEAWQQSKMCLRNALEACGKDVMEMTAQLPFQGCYLEVSYIDSLKREWPGARIEINTLLPARLAVTYEGEKKAPLTPIMISRSLFGSLERFLALMIEHTKGNFPHWLMSQTDCSEISKPSQRGVGESS